MEAIYVSVGPDLGRIEEKFLSPHQPSLDARLDDLFKEAPEYLYSEALAGARQRGVERQWFVETVSEVPADTQTVGRNAHQLPLTADILEKHDQLQAKKDHRVH